MAHRQRGPQEVVMFAVSHRPRPTALAAVAAALAIAALPAPAVAQPAVDHGVPAIPVNAPGTNVAARDQQSVRPVVNARGTDVSAADQQAPIVDNPGAVRPSDSPDGSWPTPLLLALIALGLTLAGLGLASRLAATRRRARAAA
jgi:hypothetical protein